MVATAVQPAPPTPPAKHPLKRVQPALVEKVPTPADASPSFKRQRLPAEPTSPEPATLHELLKEFSARRPTRGSEGLRALFQDACLETAVITNPRPGLSVYLKRGQLPTEPTPTALGCYLLLGLHPQQAQWESTWTRVRELWVAHLFCNNVRRVLGARLKPCEAQVEALEAAVAAALSEGDAATAGEDLWAQCQRLCVEVAKGGRYHIETLQRQLQGLQTLNCTLSNALLQTATAATGVVITEVFYKPSQDPRFEKVSFSFFDESLDDTKPAPLSLKPGLRLLLSPDGPQTLAKMMATQFWHHLAEEGYFAAHALQQQLTPTISAWLLSSLQLHGKVPLQAHFAPQHSLSLYLHGLAGSGKSSFVRCFGPALSATIAAWLDPGLLVRFVKQNLNKPLAELELELEPRPNNNDLSLMSIITSRKQTMAQAKPGVVMVAFEEVPSANGDMKINQKACMKLIASRLKMCSPDPMVVSLFSSNYPLFESCRQCLQQLQLWQRLQVVHVFAVSEQDRVTLARHILQGHLQKIHRSHLPVHLHIPLGDGDARPLMRMLAVLGFWMQKLVSGGGGDTKEGVCIRPLREAPPGGIQVCYGSQQVSLLPAANNNLFPASAEWVDARACACHSAMQQLPSPPPGCLSHIVDYFFGGVLAPAVVLSNDGALITRLCDHLASQQGVGSILGIDAGTYKMSKSLYDARDTPNMRDDVKEAKSQYKFVLVNLVAETLDSQLCIRELIEDTPSMTAFSSQSSALRKEGLFFAIHVSGAISPELRSRASLVI